MLQNSSSNRRSIITAGKQGLLKHDDIICVFYYEGIQRHEAAILSALHADLNKSEAEAYMTEIGYALKEISFLMRRLPALMKPQKVKTSNIDFPNAKVH